MSDFHSLVQAVFAFLVEQYGFAVARTVSTGGELVEYHREPLSITISWYIQEIEVNFSIGFEFSRDHKVFRPYISRTFPMWELVLGPKRDKNPDAYRHLPGMCPTTTLAQAEVVLREEARIMQEYCRPILQGDLAALEAITLERRAEVK